MTWQLRPDQLEDLSYFINNPFAINGNEPGTGKTPVECVEQVYRWQQHQAGTIWVQPKSLLRKNLEEAMFFGEWQPDEITIIDGTPAQVEKQMEASDKVKLMGFDRFKRIMKQGGFPERFTALAVDEFHKGFGGHESGNTGAMYEFMDKRGKFFRPMSGTIINGKLDTAYPAIRVIEPRYYGTFDAFKNHHYLLDLWTGKRTGYQNHDRLRKILERHGTHRLWKDIHGEEKKVIQIEKVELEPEQKPLYDTFERDALLELEKFFVDGTLPGVHFARARQIMEHPNVFPDLRFPDSGMTVDIMPGKRPGKLERLDLHLTQHAELGTPVVVFSSMIPQQREILALAKSLGLRFALITGEVEPKDRQINSKRFIAGELDGVVASSNVSDVGWNWQFWGPNRIEVSHCIYATLPFTDGIFWQSYMRFMREARQSALRITVLKYETRVDYRVADIVNQKSADAHLVDPNREIFHL